MKSRELNVFSQRKLLCENRNEHFKYYIIVYPFLHFLKVESYGKKKKEHDDTLQTFIQLSTRRDNLLVRRIFLLAFSEDNYA